jgi:hypothetical protein
MLGLRRYGECGFVFAYWRYLRAVHVMSLMAKIKLRLAGQ